MKQQAQCFVLLALLVAGALPGGVSVAGSNVAEHKPPQLKTLPSQTPQSPASNVVVQRKRQDKQKSNAAPVVLQQEQHTQPVGQPPQYYRPFADRFKSKKQRFNPGDEETENHMGYAHFMEENPRHPLVPNSIDRNAESNVIFTFSIFTFAMVVGPLFIHYLLQDHKPEWQVLCMLVFFSIPLLLSMFWVMGVVLQFFGHPARRSVAGGHWQCNGMIWYLAFFPTVTVLLFVSVVLYYVPRLLNMDPGAQMGQMIGSNQGKDGTVGPAATKAGTGVKGILVTIRDVHFPGWALGLLVFLEVALFLLGIVLTYLLDYNSHYCQPEVWYTTAVLVTVTAMLVGISCLLLCCRQVGFAVANSRWIRDFMRSFDESWRAADMAPAPPMASLASKPAQPYSKRDVATWAPPPQRQPMAVPSTLQPSFANTGYPPRSVAPDFPAAPNRPLVPALPSRAVVDCAPPRDAYAPAFPPQSQSYPGALQSYQVPPNDPMKWPSAGFAAPFAGPPGQSPVPVAQGFAVGSRVEARYGRDPQYHPGKVVGKNPSGTYQVAYDDGDHWDDVPADSMRAAA